AVAAQRPVDLDGDCHKIELANSLLGHASERAAERVTDSLLAVIEPWHHGHRKYNARRRRRFTRYRAATLLPRPRVTRRRTWSGTWACAGRRRPGGNCPAWPPVRRTCSAGRPHRPHWVERAAPASRRRQAWI